MVAAIRSSGVDRRVPGQSNKCRRPLWLALCSCGSDNHRIQQNDESQPRYALQRGLFASYFIHKPSISLREEIHSV